MGSGFLQGFEEDCKGSYKRSTKDLCGFFATAAMAFRLSRITQLRNTTASYELHSKLHYEPPKPLKLVVLCVGSCMQFLKERLIHFECRPPFLGDLDREANRSYAGGSSSSKTGAAVAVAVAVTVAVVVVVVAAAAAVVLVVVVVRPSTMSRRLVHVAGANLCTGRLW